MHLFKDIDNLYQRNIHKELTPITKACFQHKPEIRLSKKDIGNIISPFSERLGKPRQKIPNY